MESQYEDYITKLRQDVVFMVNTSRAMFGESLEQINKTLQALLPMIKNASERREVQLSVKVIKFDSSAEWVDWNAEQKKQFISFESFSVNHCDEANIVCAIDLLKFGFQQQFFGCGSCRPVVILISDGLHDNTDKISDDTFNQENLPLLDEWEYDNDDYDGYLAKNTVPEIVPFSEEDGELDWE